MAQSQSPSWTIGDLSDVTWSVVECEGITVCKYECHVIERTFKYMDLKCIYYLRSWMRFPTYTRTHTYIRRPFKSPCFNWLSHFWCHIAMTCNSLELNQRQIQICGNPWVCRSADWVPVSHSIRHGQRTLRSKNIQYCVFITFGQRRTFSIGTPCNTIGRCDIMDKSDVVQEWLSTSKVAILLGLILPQHLHRTDAKSLTSLW